MLTASRKRLPTTSPDINLVCADSHALAPTCDFGGPLRGRLAFGSAVRGAGLHVDHQTVPIVGQHTDLVAQQRGCRIAYAEFPLMTPDAPA